MDIAMKLLYSKLVAKQEKEKREKEETRIQNQDENTWGNQVIVFFFQFYIDSIVCTSSFHHDKRPPLWCVDE